MLRKWREALQRLLVRLGLVRPEKIMYIGGSDTLPPPLSREEEAVLLSRLDQGEEQARSTLIERNLRLVVYIARRFENTGINIEDLISIGTIGLIKAINTYRTDKNIKLATYASRCIENEILMYLRKNASQRGEVSLDEPLNTDWDGNELLLSDVLGTEADTVMRPIEDDVDRQLLAAAIDKLPEREREIIVLRFGLQGRQEQTQKEVADKLGISQSYISRLEKRIIDRLKREILKMS
ncbi:MAG: RNA polymerase sporulation sigma factor SigE [Oscillospiraceae bacterium]|jgi:RNA polymerase sporulation-specific sigma factor|nr:RNA polymerase sporulation sigma factor SigE [Oscillospiraceae bacterium]MCI8757541.1 RNA polymerase sporulation sigma factor SigE [Oscillospiraceae bacterium]MCI9562896.1 RNA polymerase sporulation sigma factor SigE [Oscillospiraceae bacterium]